MHDTITQLEPLGIKPWIKPQAGILFGVICQRELKLQKLQNIVLIIRLFLHQETRLAKLPMLVNSYALM